jgi:hypothetical protein
LIKKAILLVAITSATYLDLAVAKDLSELELRHRESISTTEGKSYESAALRAFWGDLSYMPQCAAEAGSQAQPIKIYYEIDLNGSMSDLVIAPETPLGQCIRLHVQDHTFPKPPYSWVGKIKFSIQQ